MTPQTNLKTYLCLLKLVCIVMFVIVLLRIILAIHTLQTTSLVHIKTVNGTNAAIMISQPNHTAALLGRGSVDVRLKPGDYVISAEHNSNQAYTTVHISKQTTVYKTIDLNNIDILPSTSDVGFTNFNKLVDNGLSSDQLSYLKNLLNTFAPTAKSIYLDSSSVVVVPHDATSANPFQINFTLHIDKTVYAAQLLYPDLENIQLILHDQSGNEIYNKTAPSSPDS